MLVCCLLNHNGKVKVNFLHTMNVTVTEPTGRSYRSPVQIFAVKISFRTHTCLCTRMWYERKKTMRVSFSRISHAVYILAKVDSLSDSTVCFCFDFPDTLLN